MVIWGTGILFILGNSLFLLGDNYYFSLLALIPAILYAALFAPGKLFMAIVFLTPFSIELSRLTGGVPFDLYLPTEPLIILLLVLVLMRFIHQGSFNRDVAYHPLSLAIFFYLFWLFITTLTSSMPLVSMKSFMMRFWFIMLFYFFALKLFSYQRNIQVFLWCYILAFTIVVIYTLYNHAGYGFFSQRAAHWVVRPFYNDHTAYGAALAMFIPVLAALAARERQRSLRWVISGMLILFVIALVFSYSRAAWISLVVALIVWTIIRFRIRFVTLAVFSVFALLLVFMLRHDIVREMENNTQDSSADFREHIRSITNITSDASNLERINRWKAAIAMFREKPFFGWGPGTYMFQYAPFQFSYDRTIISTNFAEGGDAHSEYLGPLAESGLAGMISFMLVAGFALYTGFRLLSELKSRNDRLLVTGVLLGLITYLTHGVLNNFLHSDKSAIPFWGFAAILVAIDLYRKKSPVITPGFAERNGKSEE